MMPRTRELLLPDHPLLEAPGMYLFPVRVMEERGYVGRDVWGSSLRVAPHLPDAACWADAFYIDLSCCARALQDYGRVRYEET